MSRDCKIDPQKVQSSIIINPSNFTSDNLPVKNKPNKHISAMWKDTYQIWDVKPHITTAIYHGSTAALIKLDTFYCGYEIIWFLKSM